MNALGYQAMVLGNHEFNFGLKTSSGRAKTRSFPWLSANTAVEPGAARQAVRAVYRRRGSAASRSPSSASPRPPSRTGRNLENFAGYRFANAAGSRRSAVAEAARASSAPTSSLWPPTRARARRARRATPERERVRRSPSGVPGIDAIVYRAHAPAGGGIKDRERAAGAAEELGHFAGAYRFHARERRGRPLEARG